MKEYEKIVKDLKDEAIGLINDNVKWFMYNNVPNFNNDEVRYWQSTIIDSSNLLASLIIVYGDMQPSFESIYDMGKDEVLVNNYYSNYLGKMEKLITRTVQYNLMVNGG